MLLKNRRAHLHKAFQSFNRRFDSEASNICLIFHVSFHWRRYSQRRGQADDIRLVEVHCCQHTATKFLFLVVLVCVGVRVMVWGVMLVVGFWCWCVCVQRKRPEVRACACCGVSCWNLSSLCYLLDDILCSGKYGGVSNGKIRYLFKVWHQPEEPVLFPICVGQLMPLDTIIVLDVRFSQILLYLPLSPKHCIFSPSWNILSINLIILSVPHNMCVWFSGNVLNQVLNLWLSFLFLSLWTKGNDV